MSSNDPNVQADPLWRAIDYKFPNAIFFAVEKFGQSFCCTSACYWGIAERWVAVDPKAIRYPIRLEEIPVGYEASGSARVKPGYEQIVNEQLQTGTVVAAIKPNFANLVQDQQRASDKEAADKQLQHVRSLAAEEQDKLNNWAKQRTSEEGLQKTYQEPSAVIFKSEPSDTKAVTTMNVTVPNQETLKDLHNANIGPGDDNYGRNKPFDSVIPDMTKEQREEMIKYLLSTGKLSNDNYVEPPKDEKKYYVAKPDYDKSVAPTSPTRVIVAPPGRHRIDIPINDAIAHLSRLLDDYELMLHRHIPNDPRRKNDLNNARYMVENLGK